MRPAPLRAGIAWAAWAWRALCRASTGRAGRCSWRLLDRFGDAHDRLWATVRRELACAVVRDASYLNWKYVEQPCVSARRIEVVDAQGEVRGLCVWTLHPADTSHAYARGWILDIVVPAADAEAVRATFEAAAADAAAQGAAVLEFDALAPALDRVLRRMGWVRGGVTRHLRVAAHDVPEDVQARLATPDGWFLTRGDSDGDHPWWTPAGREPEGPTA